MSEVLANKEPAIYKAIQEGVERINAKATSNAMRVQKWVILERDFSIGGGELGEWFLNLPVMSLLSKIKTKQAVMHHGNVLYTGEVLSFGFLIDCRSNLNSSCDSEIKSPR